jgi:hypothetical protein
MTRCIGFEATQLFQESETHGYGILKPYKACGHVTQGKWSTWPL